MQHRWKAWLLAAMTAVALAPAGPALAIDIRPGIDPTSTQIQPLELRNLESRFQRQQYEQQQQFFRELDRESAARPTRRPVVPRVIPNCQDQVFGSRFLPSCR